MSYRIDRKRRAKMTFEEQMGNIGSEVSRTIKGWRSQDKIYCIAAVCRALDLFNATIECLIQNNSPRLEEVYKSRDQYIGLLYDGKFEEDADRLDKYFFEYALIARAGR